MRRGAARRGTLCNATHNMAYCNASGLNVSTCVAASYMSTLDALKYALRRCAMPCGVARRRTAPHAATTQRTASGVKEPLL